MWLFLANPPGRVSVIGFCLCITLLTAHVSRAATITIDSDCPLKAAITAANSDSNSHDTDCTAGSGADTIVFASGSADTHYVNPGAALDIITTHITIEGAGKEIQGAAGPAEWLRVLEVGSGGKLTLKGLKVSFGKTFYANDGAGIMVSAGEAILIGVEVTENNSSNRGGGISVWNRGTLTVINSRIHNNTSASGGGGVYAEPNTQVTISGSEITSNRSGTGAGIHSIGRLTVSNSTIADNDSSANNGKGGGIFVAGGSATVSHVTLWGNQADSNSNITNASQIYISGASATMALRNSIVCDSSIATHDLVFDRGGSLSQNAGNVIGKGSAQTSAACASLGSRTGAPAYYLPPAGHSALANGDDSICKAYPTDQAGRGRPAADCDSGSIERGGSNYIYVDSGCTLSQAIQNANDDAQTNSGCEAGVDADTAEDIIRLTVNVSQTSGTESATSKITVEGNGKTVSRSGVSNVRLFHVGSGGNLTLRNITLSGGRDTQGAAVHSRGTLTMEDCVVTGNTATTDDAGGVIIWDNSNATITRCVFTNNSAGKEGGAINVASGSMTITDSVFRGNTAGNEGGAANLETGTLTISGSSFIDNKAESQSYTENYGGAIYVYDGALNVSSSTFSGNHGEEGGGAIYVGDGTLSSSNLTLWNNTSSGTGYVTGIHIAAAGTANLYNSIIGRDVNQGGAFCGGSFQSQTQERGNIISHADGACPQAKAENPRLGALTGTVPYFPLLAGSPAIGNGVAQGCAFVIRDQAGRARPASKCDSGAVQYVAGELVVKTSGGGGGTYSPTPIPCSGEWLNANTGIQVSATYDICSGIQFQRRDASAIGIGWVIEAGFQDAVDVWGWVRPTATVCFPQAGSTLFINASTTPHTVEQLPSWLEGRSTCASVGVHGLVVLLPIDSPHTTSPSAGGAQNTLSDCMVTTKARLNLRYEPGGTIIGVVPANAALTTFASKDGWYHVDYYGTRGWISGDYAAPAGDCG